jgi:phosphoribosylanthranilate isomerase
MGADYLGLNFYPGSPRFLTIERAREVADAVRGRVPLVRVLMDASPLQIEETAGRVGLDLVQLSGDEDLETVAPFAARARATNSSTAGELRARTSESGDSGS